MKKSIVLTTAALAISISFANSALIGHYVFTDGDLTDNEVGVADTLTLTTMGATPITISAEGAGVFPGEATTDRDWLDVNRGAGAPAFTASVWFRTNTVNQGTFQGIFSNNTSSASFSWQVDVNNGTLRLVAATAGFGSVTNAEAGEPAIQTGVWHQVVARKVNSTSAELWFGSEGSALQLIGTSNVNLGGLQWYRLGVNRNSDSLYEMEMANVQIWDDATVSLTDLNAEGPMLNPIPEPGSLALLLLGGLVGLRRRR